MNDDKRVRSALKNLKNQSENLQGIKFKVSDYLKIPKVKNYVIYCDPPYLQTTKYKYNIDHKQFYDWCYEMGKDNIIFVSEYQMPKQFKCIWQKEVRSDLKSNIDVADRKVEKLFIL